MTEHGPHLACQLALQGSGVGLFDENLANVYVSSGQLVRVLPDWHPTEVQVQTSENVSAANRFDSIELNGDAPIRQETGFLRSRVPFH